MAADSQYIGSAVKRRREELELTQTGLASLANVSRGTIRNAESGVITPNPATWLSLERALAWAPGSLERIDEGYDPIPLFPADAIAPVLHFVLKRAESDSPWSDRRQEFVTMLGLGVDKNGEISSENLSKIFDLIEEIAPNQDQADRATAALEEELQRRAGVNAAWERPRTDGDADGGKEVSQDAQRRLGLSPEVTELLESGQIIDYGISKPKKAENLSVVTLLVKDGGASLSRKDRRYIGEPWDDLGDLIEAGARLKKPDPVAKDDPWASPPPAKKQNDGFDDEPPF